MWLPIPNQGVVEPIVYYEDLNSCLPSEVVLGGDVVLGLSQLVAQTDEVFFSITTNVNIQSVIFKLMLLDETGVPLEPGTLRLLQFRNMYLDMCVRS